MEPATQLDEADFWVATAALTARSWRANRVPTAFARRTMSQARQQL